MKNQLRKYKHKKFIYLYILDLRWEAINLVIAAGTVDEMTEAQKKKLTNIGRLIRKYERRQRLLKF